MSISSDFLFSLVTFARLSSSANKNAIVGTVNGGRW